MFEVNKEQLVYLQQKYITSCPLCKGARILEVNTPTGIQYTKCSCVLKFNEIYSLVQANIPVHFHDTLDMDPEYKNANRGNLEKLAKYRNKLAWALERGVGLFIQGHNGAGKSYLGVAVLKKAIKEGHTAYFILLEDLINIGYNAMRNMDLRKELHEFITTVDFLMIDEIDKMHIDRQDTTISLLNSLLHARYCAGKPLIVTSSTLKQELVSSSSLGIFNERLLDLTFVGNNRSKILKSLEDELFKDE